MSTSTDPGRALPSLVLTLQHSAKNIQPYKNTASAWETKTKWNQLGKANNRENFLLSGTSPSFTSFLHGLHSWRTDPCKEDAAAPEKSWNGFWIIKERLQDVRGKSNPGDLPIRSPEMTGGKRQCKKGLGNAPKYSQLTVHWDNS